MAFNISGLLAYKPLYFFLPESMLLFSLPGIHGIPDLLPIFPEFRFSFTLGIYLAWTILLYLLARKTEHKSIALLAFVPVLNFALLFKLGRLSPWLALFMFIPVVNCLMLALAYYRIVRKAGKPWWWTALLFINPLSIVIMIMLVSAYEEKTDPTSAGSGMENPFDDDVDPFTQKAGAD